MAKKTNEKATEKKEFSWDTEKMIGEFGDNTKKTEVRICTLNGKTYVSAQSYVMSKKTEDWKRTKNNTMEMSLFKDLQEMVGKWEAGEEKPKKPAGGLKAKQQAKGAKEAASKKKTLTKGDKKYMEAE